MNAKRIHLLLILSLLAALLPWGAPAAQAAPGQLLPAGRLRNPDGTLRTGAGVATALDLRGWNVTLDSARGPILTRGVAAQRRNRMPGSRWPTAG